MKQTNKITIKADGYRLVPDWAVVGTEGSYGMSALVFEFGDAWDGLVRRVTFFPANGSDAIEVMAEGTDVVVPPEVMSVAGTAEYVLDGTRDGVRLISLCGRLRVLQTKEPGGADPAEPTQDVYSQIVSLIKAGALSGKSAYEIALEYGFEGSEGEWIASLNGEDYVLTDSDKTEIAKIVSKNFINAKEVAM